MLDVLVAEMALRGHRGVITSIAAVEHTFHTGHRQPNYAMSINIAYNSIHCTHLGPCLLL